MLLLLPTRSLLKCSSLRSAQYLCAYSHRRAAALRRRKHSPKIALPAESMEKIAMWRRHIAEEIDYQLGIDASIDNLQYRAFDIDPVNGYVFEFEAPSTLCETQLERFRRSFTCGAWIQVQFDGNGNEWSGIVLDQHEDVVRVRLYDLPRATRAEQASSISMKLNPDQCALTAILKFWSDENEWSKMAGYKNFLRAHRALPFKHAKAPRKFSPFIKTLNTYQKDAIGRALDPHQSFLSIQGPPGTGKTNAVAEMILQFAHRDKKVLLLASSNQAVDNVASRVYDLQANAEEHCRPSFAPSSVPYSMEKKIHTHEFYGKLAATCEAGTATRQSRYIRDAAILQNDMRMNIMGESQVIYATLTSASLRKLKKAAFTPDLVIIDEAGQAAEWLAWYGIMHAPRAIVVGDHQQLGPSIRSKALIEEKFSRSVPEYLEDEFGDKFQLMLKRQYRANERIMRWSSDTFYHGALEADDSVRNIELADLLHANAVQTSVAHLEPLVYIDTAHAGVDYFERYVDHSYSNEGEAAQIEAQVRALIAVGVRVSDIGIITPYVAQTELIKSKMQDIENLAVSSVDSFQGQEREVICISMVRSRMLGFLKEIRRTNVSVTRAKRQLFVVANSAILKQDSTLATLAHFLRDNAKVISLASPMPTKEKRKRQKASA